MCIVALCLFLRWVKFCSDCFRQVFFSFGRQKAWLLVTLDRWLSFAVPIAWEFAWVDSVVVVIDEWLSYRGGRLNRFDCRRRISSKKKIVYMWNQYYHYFDLPKIRVSWDHTQKIKLPLPKSAIEVVIWSWNIFY